MTAVGEGLRDDASALPQDGFPTPRTGAPGASLWSGGRGDLFRDQRAAKVGDVLTVNISINDKATLGNSSDRSRQSKVSNSLDYALGLFGLASKGSGQWGDDASSSSKGQGNIDRSEKIQLSVAAIVTRVLPNGNLLISGSQEIRVNYELRILNIAGVARPSDIARDNTIAYDKIAEARVSYGGRGRLTEVQQPALVHQVYDVVSPF
jgi:flagellar L-ring protein precursor FlgH